MTPDRETDETKTTSAQTVAGHGHLHGTDVETIVQIATGTETGMSIFGAAAAAAGATGHQGGRARTAAKKITAGVAGLHATTETAAQVGTGIETGTGLPAETGHARGHGHARALLRTHPTAILQNTTDDAGTATEKKERRERRERKKKGLAVVEWGKYGTLESADMYNKQEEFYAWLIGERNINPGQMSKSKDKELFEEFREEWNTGTLSEKYVDLKKWEAKMNAIRAGETIEDVDTYDARKDMEALRSSQRRPQKQTETFLDRSRLEELRKVQQERTEIEKMKRLGMEVKSSMGVLYDK
ncbi:hypothetical protein OIV83_003531 [Microbotryomycetes sp. JL201]|nr:hypothetical protein OIV83_003531 [Microbotryomycetes sp. JL201]